MKRAIIIYHKNCMDGLASAYITKEALSNSNDKFFFFTNIETLPMQYGEEYTLFKNNEIELNSNDTIYFVDFSLKKDAMIELSSKVNNIVVLDHHKTAEANLKDIEDDIENITVIFDMNKSGATICYDYFKQILPKEKFADNSMFRYIEDRDLWKWKMPYSKEINAALRFYVDTNSLESFEDIYTGFDLNSFIATGDLLILQQQKQVESKIKKVKDIKIQGINFKCLNATENISEIGNAICTTYNTPALVYFITENMDVVCSLRSTDELEDVSVIAKALGGGGHRNACGFTANLNQLSDARSIR